MEKIDEIFSAPQHPGDLSVLPSARSCLSGSSFPHFHKRQWCDCSVILCLVGLIGSLPTMPPAKNVTAWTLLCIRQHETQEDYLVLYDRVQTELADTRSLSFVNSSFFTTHLVTNSHWSREDPEQKRRTSKKDVLCSWVSQFPLVPWYSKIIVVFTTWYIKEH